MTILTAPRVVGRTPAYDDEVAAEDRAWFGYKYEGTNPSLGTNVAVRKAAEAIDRLARRIGVAPFFAVAGATFDDAVAEAGLLSRGGIGADVLRVSADEVGVVKRSRR